MADEAIYQASRLTYRPPSVETALKRVEFCGNRARAGEPDFQDAVKYKSEAAQIIIGLETLARQAERTADEPYRRLFKEQEFEEDRRADLDCLAKVLLSLDPDLKTSQSALKEALASIPENTQFMRFYARAALPVFRALDFDEAVEFSRSIPPKVARQLVRLFIDDDLVDEKTLTSSRAIIEALPHGENVEKGTLDIPLTNAADRLRGDLRAIVALGILAEYLQMKSDDSAQLLAPHFKRAYEEGAESNQFLYCLKMCQSKELIANVSDVLTKIALADDPVASKDALTLLDNLAANNQSTGYAVRNIAQHETHSLVKRTLDSYNPKSFKPFPEVIQALEVVSRIGDGQTTYPKTAPYRALTMSIIRIIEIGDDAMKGRGWSALIRSARTLDQGTMVNYLAAKLGSAGSPEEKKLALAAATTMKSAALPLADNIALLAGIERVAKTCVQNLSAPIPTDVRDLVRTALEKISPQHEALKLLRAG